ncbi:MAG: XkdF-like putative serine protease domain-containing protein [Alphaproteobacteria bacterium]
MSKNEKHIIAKVSSVSDELGIIFGWAIISKIKGEPYFDLQGDHIPEKTVLKAGAKFMAGDRLAADMHQWKDDTPVKIGNVIFAFPLTGEIAKAMSISTGISGLMVGMKVDDPAVLKKFKSGEYTGFSIGGYRLKDEDILDG